MPKVLIVDDSPAIRKQVATTLSAEGFDVIEAADGVEALDLLRKGAEVALVIVDLNMPRMDGFQLLAAMRDLGGSPIRSVMMTTETRIELVEKAKRAGAKGWLVKPFKSEHLVSVARRLTTPGAVLVTGTMAVVSPEILARVAAPK
jgi:two-component system, chemotaxis family, chemotaxis protein CheY